MAAAAINHTNVPINALQVDKKYTITHRRYGGGKLGIFKGPKEDGNSAEFNLGHTKRTFSKDNWKFQEIPLEGHGPVAAGMGRRRKTQRLRRNQRKTRRRN